MSATPMANLSDLPHDMLVVIAQQLKKLEDFVSFRCVSKSVHAAAKDEYFEGIPCRKRTPYLMLPVRDDGNDDVRELYSLVEGESIVASVKLPKLKTRKCFESLGWLLVVEEDGSMFLLDPFSGTEIPVPHQTTYPEYHWEGMAEYVFIQKMVLSARPSETSDFILMVIAGGLGHLAFWRLGDKAWNKIETRKGRFLDVVYDGGEQFYAIGFPGFVWAINLAEFGNNGEEARVITCCKSIVPFYHSYNLYILKTTDDTLLFIIRAGPDLRDGDLSDDDDLRDDDLCYMRTDFEVYEVDITTGKLEEIESLGSMAVFIGENSTIAVDASSFPGGVIKPNHIYFTDDNWEYYYFNSKKGGGKDIGVYNLETETVESIHPGDPLFSRVSPSIWITPCY